MHFGLTLKNSIYDPWKTHYIDYSKLQNLLKEDKAPAKTSDKGRAKSDNDWTEDDEAAFVEELINVQLEKVNGFQVSKYKDLKSRTSQCESTLESLLKPTTSDDNADETSQPAKSNIALEQRKKELEEVQKDLDQITKETNELEKFSRVNYTGFLKAAKKHDRKRGQQYRIRPMLDIRLNARPFNSEDYSPLLYKLSAMFAIVRQQLSGKTEARANSSSNDPSAGDKYTAHKFWVHPDNLLEVKTYILRRLPVLVYNPQSSRVAEGGQKDPTITSLYFDNPQFSLYTRKLDRKAEADSLRLRWYGQLNQRPEIFLEKKTVKPDDRSEETRIPIKDKYVQPFIKGEYRMEKSVQKLKERDGAESERAKQLERNAQEITSFIQDNHLQPVLRANYTRTAFQIPGDNSVRVSLDTDLALIREDSFDETRPCRDPDDWHRVDIDENAMEWPFNGFRKGEISKFPYSVLEIKIKDNLRKRKTEWIEDLMHSHLVKEAPRFSKFAHGIAQLFEDYVNSFPFWLSEVDKDIRKDPETAFEEEQDNKAKKAELEFAVGSRLEVESGSPRKHSVASPSGKSHRLGKSPLAAASAKNTLSPAARPSKSRSQSEAGVAEDEESSNQDKPTGLSALFPSFSTGTYGALERRKSVQLPPGVRHPGVFIKDTGPVRVEAKVWLANQRTFIKWQHITVLLASLSLGLYNAAGASNNVARGLAVIYLLVAAFAGVWGWSMYLYRSKLIKERSGKDFDNPIGPIVVCLGLIGALCLNFTFKYRTAMAKSNNLSLVEIMTNATSQYKVDLRRSINVE